jgi:hypothetical protein
LSKHSQVIAVDSRAQGKSTDSGREITYALMASDMSALLDHLNVGSAHVENYEAPDDGVVMAANDPLILKMMPFLSKATETMNRISPAAKRSFLIW